MELAADKRAASPLDFELEECDGKTLLRLFRADPQPQMSSMAAAMAEAAVAGGGESVAGSARTGKLGSPESGGAKPRCIDTLCVTTSPTMSTPAAAWKRARNGLGM